MSASALQLAVYTLALLSILPCLYLAAMIPPAIMARRRGMHVPDEQAPGHLVFVIPAHDEHADIEDTLASLEGIVDVDCSIHVIADNCSDDTAELARAWAAQHNVATIVWERHHETQRTKGYALAWGLPQIFAWTDAHATPAAFVCIIDADATVTPDSVTRARAGFASGQTVLQSEYVFREGLGVRAAVMRIAAAGFVVRGLGRTFLGLSDTLKGNGMWFAREVLNETPWCAYSLAEDLENSTLLVDRGRTVHTLVGSQVTGKLAADTKGETSPAAALGGRALGGCAGGGTFSDAHAIPPPVAAASRSLDRVADPTDRPPGTAAGRRADTRSVRNRLRLCGDPDGVGRPGRVRGLWRSARGAAAANAFRPGPCAVLHALETVAASETIIASHSTRWIRTSR